MPCWELFERQDEAYQSAVIQRGTVRVAVEAAARQGWERWIGEGGGFVGMSGFGTSGPETEPFPQFGVTPQAVTAEACQRLRKSAGFRASPPNCPEPARRKRVVPRCALGVMLPPGTHTREFDSKCGDLGIKTLIQVNGHASEL